MKWWNCDWFTGRTIDCHKKDGGTVMDLKDILLIATSKMVTLMGLVVRLLVATSKMVAL